MQGTGKAGVVFGLSDPDHREPPALDISEADSRNPATGLRLARQKALLADPFAGAEGPVGDGVAQAVAVNAGREDVQFGGDCGPRTTRSAGRFATHPRGL